MSDNNTGQELAGDRFFFEAFRDSETEVTGNEVRELVVLPKQRTNKVDYVARVLSNNFYINSSDKFPEILDRFLKLSEGAGEYNSAMIKILRSLLGLDRTEEPRGIEDNIPNDRLQYEVNRTLLEAAVCEFTGDRFYCYGKDFYELLVNAARQVDQKSGLIAEKLQGEDGFSAAGYGMHHHDDTLETVLRRNDRDRLKLRESKVPNGVRSIAEKLIELYPILNNTHIREQLVNEQDLYFTICAAFAPEVLQSPEYRDASVIVVKSEAPSRLKFVTSMMYISSDNLLRVAQVLSKTNREGYHGSSKP